MNEAEAYADEEYAQPAGDQPTYQWGDDEYATPTECEEAIAQYLVNELMNYAGVVTHGDKSYLIRINVTLIE